ncbi:hypothetical protein QWY93_06140 [Echinicola jeungdonensis]|uniref:Uncharacterized protein n=1 Tax=Echinicola jeungdonensis TaxID=709343 RepID=A0ABV5J4R3_9BACT|nr:hypothetical protein [Echinicola jeungdonensis]MDN3668903.1 hypothetical protein [Echinicola jeungdonensis]
MANAVQIEKEVEQKITSNLKASLLDPSMEIAYAGNVLLNSLKSD